MNVMYFLTQTVARLNPLPMLLGWLESRPWRLLGFGAPLLLLLMVALYMGVRTGSGRIDQLHHHYLQQASRLLQKEELAEASLRYRRALQIDPADSRAKFGMATIAEKQGKLDEATRLMEQLAEGRGDVARVANHWLIAHMPRTDLSVEDRRKLLMRLERAAKDDPTNIDNHLQLAMIYGQLGMQEKSLDHLRVVAEARPEMRITLIQQLARSGNLAGAALATSESEQLFRDRVAKRPDDLNSRMMLSTTLLFQKKYADAIHILEQGLPISGQDDIRKAIAMVNVSWANDLLARGKDSSEVLERTSAALKIDPGNSLALNLLMRLSREGDDSEKAIEQLRAQLAQGDAPWLVHLILGTRLLEQGETTDAAQHLEQALQLNPSAVGAINNLAWTLATQENPELDRAESLVQQAIRISPETPQIRETRGQIYLRQKRWKEALTDLESVLPFYSKEPRLADHLPMLHTSLSEAYDNLGNAAMARQHADLAEQKKALLPKPEAEQK